MLALQILAAIFLGLSAACFFGPQLVIYGPRALPVLLKHRQARFIGGALVTATVFAVLAPHFGAAIDIGGEQVVNFALRLQAMSFGLA